MSLYEEYRGFRINGGHRRTSPNTKDLFVYDEDNLGLGYFAASDLDVNLVNFLEFDYVSVSDPAHQNPRVINFNHEFAHLADVHVLALKDGPVDGGLGVAVGGPGTPEKIVRVVVDRSACLASGWKELEVMTNIAHELAHSCNVIHHGDKNYPSAGRSGSGVLPGRAIRRAPWQRRMAKTAASRTASCATTAATTTSTPKAR